MQNDPLEKELEALVTTIGRGVGNCAKLFGLGLWQLRKPAKLGFVVVCILVGVIGLTLLSLPLWAVLVLPVLPVLVFGSMRQTEIEFYRKAFLDVGFKGRDGRAPYLISKRDLGNRRTGCYFRSNIPLTQWKTSMPALQTALDCTILTIENGKSQKIVHTVSIPAGMALPKQIDWSSSSMNSKPSVIVLGESMAGVIHFDLNSTPHWILAGSTGSGKSVLMRLVVFQCLAKGHKVYLMDFKQGVEFGKAYDDFCEVVMDKGRAVQVLSELVEENKQRLNEFRKRGIKNLDEYNHLNKDDQLERIVVFVDELAILLLPTGDKKDSLLSAQASTCLSNIAILGRAAGINLVFGIQRPDANTVTGQIKSNVSGRVCGYFADSAPSMIVLNNTRATEIDSEAKGRFMFQDGKETIEFQAYYQSEEQAMESLIDKRTEQFAPKETVPKLSAKVKNSPISGPELDFDYDS